MTPAARLRSSILLDLKATFRGLRRRPAFTTAAVATIALAIAASTAMFSAVDAILLRALPYASPERLVAMLPGTFVANRELEQMRTRLQAVDEVAVFSPGWLMPLVGLDEPRQVNAARVSGNLFPMVGTRAALGRALDRESEVPGASVQALKRASVQSVSAVGALRRAPDQCRTHPRALERLTACTLARSHARTLKVAPPPAPAASP